MEQNDLSSITRDPFPKNSKTKAKVAPIEAKVTTEKVVKRIVTEGAKIKKRRFGKKLKEEMIDETGKEIKNHLVNEMIIPAIKSLICDMVGWGGTVELILFGTRNGNRGYRGPTTGLGLGGSNLLNRAQVNYSGISWRNQPQQPQTQAISPLGRARHDFGEITIPNRGEAELVLEHLSDLIVDYGQATIADLYEIVGIEVSQTDYSFGWTNIQGARVIPVRGAYLLDLPRVEVLPE